MPAKRKPRTTTPVTEEETPIDVEFSEDEEGIVTATFPSMNGVAAFTIQLQNMNWGLLETLDGFSEEDATNKDLLGFFHEYIVGGPRAVPIKHTMVVFQAIRAYMDEVSAETKNV